MFGVLALGCLHEQSDGPVAGHLLQGQTTEQSVLLKRVLGGVGQGQAEQGGGQKHGPELTPCGGAHPLGIPCGPGLGARGQGAVVGRDMR